MNIHFNVRKHRLMLLHILRYWSISLPHLTPWRLANVAINLLEFASSRTRLISYPPMVKIEASLNCNIACPGCFQVMSGARRELQGDEFVDLERLDSLLRSISKRSIGVNLAFRGEALLHPRILDVIALVESNGMASFFPTNLSVERDRSFFERLVASGVDCLSVSLDGTTAESYRRYRRGGDFDLVLRNIATIAEIKRERRTSKPHLRWKFIVFEHNRDELPTMVRDYAKLGFDSFEINYDRSSDLHSEGRRQRNQDLSSGVRRCFLPWTTLVSTWDGRAHPCFNEEAKFDLGNVLDSGFKAIWNGPGYQQLRRGLGRSPDATLNPECRKCIQLAAPPACD